MARSHLQVPVARSMVIRDHNNLLIHTPCGLVSPWFRMAPPMEPRSIPAESLPHRVTVGRIHMAPVHHLLQAILYKGLKVMQVTLLT
mmetsp:Transcript_12155/g.23095  ORF Transcript_12155/g.23095 Transcript_12155/m.23095 type:complete len:87 (+) Transcript_12155:381-641(+)